MKTKFLGSKGATSDNSFGKKNSDDASSCHMNAKKPGQTKSVSHKPALRKLAPRKKPKEEESDNESENYDY